MERVDSTRIIAIVGAVTGVLALAWRIWEWFDARRPRVSVTWGFGVWGGPTAPRLQIVHITVVNKSDHRIRVEGFGFEVPDGSGAKLALIENSTLVGSTLPGLIAAHDSGTAYVEIDLIQPRLNLTRRTQAYATTSAHGTFRSKVRPWY
jgi:hypothetical protein